MPASITINHDDILYTITEVVALLKINRNYVYRLIREEKLRSIKLGCRKVTRKELLRLLDAYEAEPGEQSVGNAVGMADVLMSSPVVQ